MSETDEMPEVAQVVMRPEELARYKVWLLSRGLVIAEIIPATETDIATYSIFEWEPR